MESVFRLLLKLSNGHNDVPAIASPTIITQVFPKVKQNFHSYIKIYYNVAYYHDCHQPIDSHACLRRLGMTTGFVLVGVIW